MSVSEADRLQLAINFLVEKNRCAKVSESLKNRHAVICTEKDGHPVGECKFELVTKVIPF